MNASEGGSGAGVNRDGGTERVAVALPRELAEQLASFCREKNVAPDKVVERALVEYFREGDVSH